MTVSTLAPTLSTDIIDIAIISADAYYLAYKFKRAQVLAVSIKNLKFQAIKEARPKIDPKSIIPEEYYNLLYIFSKKNLNTLSSHRKYDHRIILKEEQTHGYTLLYKISLELPG